MIRFPAVLFEGNAAETDPTPEPCTVLACIRRALPPEPPLVIFAMNASENPRLIG
jgi:hypothetical protein